MTHIENIALFLLEMNISNQNLNNFVHLISLSQAILIICRLSYRISQVIKLFKNIKNHKKMIKLLKKSIIKIISLSQRIKLYDFLFILLVYHK